MWGTKCGVCSSVSHLFTQGHFITDQPLGQANPDSVRTELHHFTIPTSTTRKIVPSDMWEVPKIAFLPHSLRSSNCFSFIHIPTPIHIHWHCKCSKLLLQNHGNVLQIWFLSQLSSFPKPPILGNPHQMIDIHVGPFWGGKKPSSVRLSTPLVEPFAVTLANTTSTQRKSVPCICFHSTLASWIAQPLPSLLKLYEKYLSS